MALDCLYCSACLSGSMIHNHTLAHQLSALQAAAAGLKELVGDWRQLQEGRMLKLEQR